MTIEEYQTLTGITVTDAQRPVVTAQIARSQSILESMLGYSLDPEISTENQYDELGKASDLCPFFIQHSNEDDDSLQPADAVIGSYRLYQYNIHDVNLPIDPFVKINNVKLVFVRQGETPNGITHKTFHAGRLNVLRRNGVSKYLQKCQEFWCRCECQYGCVQLAVDADWMDVEHLPLDLQVVWGDMIKYYTDCKFNVKLEVLGPHRVEKFVNEKPEELAASIAIIKKYAGPSGSVNPVVTASSNDRGSDILGRSW